MCVLSDASRSKQSTQEQQLSLYAQNNQEEKQGVSSIVHLVVQSKDHIQVTLLRSIPLLIVKQIN